MNLATSRMERELTPWQPEGPHLDPGLTELPSRSGRANAGSVSGWDQFQVNRERFQVWATAAAGNCHALLPSLADPTSSGTCMSPKLRVADAHADAWPPGTPITQMLGSAPVSRRWEDCLLAVGVAERALVVLTGAEHVGREPVHDQAGQGQGRHQRG